MRFHYPVDNVYKVIFSGADNRYFATGGKRELGSGATIFAAEGKVSSLAEPAGSLKINPPIICAAV